MREIKFRVWIKNKDWKMINCDELIFDENIPISEQLKDKKGYRYIMQYTGLKDKNNKEIFESDIVKAKTDKDKYEYFEVAYYKQAFALRNKNGHKEYLCNLSCFNCLEVVGNIYENPDF